jgi:hypothetical protein
MGGYYESERTTYRPAWETNTEESLRKFFRTGDVVHLTEAYKTYSATQDMGFIKTVLKHRNRTEALKEFPEIEYEVKFDITPIEGKNKEPSINSYLNAFEFPPTKHARFLKDAVNTVSDGKNHFFGEGVEERLVVIEKGGKTYLKEKSQPLPLITGVQYESMVVKRTEHRYEANMSEVLAKVAKESGSGAAYQCIPP